MQLWNTLLMPAAKRMTRRLPGAALVLAAAFGLAACGDPAPPQPQVEPIPEGGVRQEPPPVVEPADAPPPLEEPTEY